MTASHVRLDAIEMDVSIQCRAHIDTATVNDYAERMTEGDKFPPIALFAADGKHWIGDGWHRVMASRQIGALDIAATVELGGRSAALRHALGANAVHGHRRTNADKRRCVEIALREFPKLSSRAVAEMCAVSDMLVGSVRQVQESCTSQPVTGADGKQYPAKRTKQSRKSTEPNNHGKAQANEKRTNGKKKHAHTRPAIGLHIARVAVQSLAEIAQDDIERSAAWEFVRQWLDANDADGSVDSRLQPLRVA